ncbi:MULTISPECIES: hypothetical protein [Comamonas]|jgi:hypothetical protein|uniref:Uncharacterized protein n=1 Tax=Comamonas squillarum TaxID=2977320 RepID=A0ABY5ZUE4_9BURK|nr:MULTISPECIES: hypothetical protein [Comamonas]PWB18078.1 hypothetical protein DCO45_11790 [Comamonas sp. JNW]UXC17531.1 hypothetical protein N4T19_17770 [Comamonas sp. PR12]
MTDTEATRKNAKHLLYLMVNEELLRAGDGLDAESLSHVLERHGVSAAEQQPAMDYACEQGWLQKGENGQLQITETGFALD